MHVYRNTRQQNAPAPALGDAHALYWAFPPEGPFLNAAGKERLAGFLLKDAVLAVPKYVVLTKRRKLEVGAAVRQKKRPSDVLRELEEVGARRWGGRPVWWTSAAVGCCPPRACQPRSRLLLRINKKKNPVEFRHEI